MRSRWLAASLLVCGCRPDPGSGESADAATETSSGDELGESSDTLSLADLPHASETGEPGCLDPQPCQACECSGGAWQCTCVAADARAGFTMIEAREYSIGLPGQVPSAFEASAHRQFWSFQPADEQGWEAPLFVFFNGGPAVSSAMLLGLNIGPQTFAPSATAGADLAANPHAWTKLGNLLWIDARQVGLSYSLLDDPSDSAARQAALSFANFNSYLDAADFVRVLLRFLAANPELHANEVIVVAESYGGTRAQLMLDMLLHPQAYASGDRRLIDPSLVAEIEAHHATTLADPQAAPEQIATQFGRQILIQPALTGVTQQQSAGQLFEQPDSPIELLASELGLDYLTCAEQGQPNCSPYDNGIGFVSAAGRSPYDTRAPVSWLDDLFALVGQRCNDASVLGELLGVPLADIAGLSPATRSQAWRMVDVGAYPSDAEAGDLDAALGGLAAWDRYFLIFEVGALNRFRGGTAQQLEVDPADPHFGEHLLRNLLWVDTMISSANYDLVVYTPAIPAALAQYDSIVAGVAVEPGQWTLEYRPDAFADWPAPGARTIRVPTYAASHAVSLDAPAELLADVEAWLAGG